MMPPGCTQRDLDTAAGGYEPAERQPVHDRWEYLTFVLPDKIIHRTERLNSVGRSGWELACVADGIAYTKRMMLP